MVLRAGLSADVIVQKLAVNPRQILSIEVPAIAEGVQANLTVFDTAAEWEYNKKSNLSKSYNTPFMGQKLTGKVLLTCNNNQIFKS
jgi:dihydroorotase